MRVTSPSMWRQMRPARRPKRDANPKPEATNHAGDGMQKTHEADRKKLAETEKRDAAD